MRWQRWRDWLGLESARTAAIAGRRRDEWLEKAKGISLDGLSLAMRADLPDWLVTRLQTFMSDADILTLARGMQQPAPLDLRVNSFSDTREEVLKTLAAAGIEAAITPYSPLGVRVKGKPALNRHPMFLKGKIEIQDEGSQLIGLLMAPKRGEMVADFCAGAGGKTLLLGALMQSQGRVYAFDVSEKRLAQLKAALKAFRLEQPAPATDQQRKRHQDQAPRRQARPGAGGRAVQRARHTAPQSRPEVAPAAVRHCRADGEAGRYSHCCCEAGEGGRTAGVRHMQHPAEENEQVVETFLANHPEFALLDLRRSAGAQPGWRWDTGNICGCIRISTARMDFLRQ